MNCPTCCLWGSKPRGGGSAPDAITFAVHTHSRNLQDLRHRSHLLDNLLLALTTGSVMDAEAVASSRRRRRARHRRMYVEDAAISRQRFNLLGSTVQISAVDADSVSRHANILHIRPNLVVPLERK